MTTTDNTYSIRSPASGPASDPHTGELSPSGRKPAFYAYQVRDGGGGKSYWNRVGAAWPNRDGGFTLQLESVPLDGRVVCQPPKADEEYGYDAP